MEENHPRYQLGYWQAQLDKTRTYMLAKKDRRIHILEQVCIIIENCLITVQATVHLTGEIKFIYQGKKSITNGTFHITESQSSDNKERKV